MLSIVVDYVSSPVGIIANTVIALVFLSLAYRRFSRCRVATTGRYQTRGRITWSEAGRFMNDTDAGMDSLISYSFAVDGKSYNGRIFAGWPPARRVRKYPRGKEITVFYAPDDPTFSSAEHPPHYVVLIGDILLRLVFLPFVCLNIPSLFIYWLATIDS